MYAIKHVDDYACQTFDVRDLQEGQRSECHAGDDGRRRIYLCYVRFSLTCRL
jgi:hypothetical protein